MAGIIGSVGDGHHIHAAGFLIELHASVDEGEERVVAADADANPHADPNADKDAAL